MGDWIGLALILLIVFGGMYGLVRVNEPREPITEQEFERRAQEASGMLAAGVMGLQRILEPGVEKAVEVQQDFRAGHYDDQQEVGEGDEAGQAAKIVNSPEIEEDDA